MNKVHRISLNYLAVLMLVIANLLPAASVFAEGLTKPEENIFDSESLYIKADTKKNETNNKLIDVNYEVTNKRDQPIDHVVLKQKNQNDSPVKFDATTLKSDDQSIQFDQKKTKMRGQN